MVSDNVLRRNKSKESVFCFRHSRSIGVRLEWAVRSLSVIRLAACCERGEADRTSNSYAARRGRCGCRCERRQLDPASIHLFGCLSRPYGRRRVCPKMSGVWIIQQVLFEQTNA